MTNWGMAHGVASYGGQRARDTVVVVDFEAWELMDVMSVFGRGFADEAGGELVFLERTFQTFQLFTCSQSSNSTRYKCIASNQTRGWY